MFTHVTADTEMLFRQGVALSGRDVVLHVNQQHASKLLRGSEPPGGAL